MSRARPQPSPRAASENARALIPLAVVTGAHGVRGELRVKLYNPASDLLGSLTRVRLRRAGDAGEPAHVELQRARLMHQGLWLVALAGCDDRDAAAALRGAELCVPRHELPALAQDEHYLVDFAGLRALLPDGRELGVVERAIEYPAAQVLSVRVPGGTLEVPLREPYVRAVAFEAGSVTVDQIEDLELLAERGSKRS